MRTGWGSARVAVVVACASCLPAPAPAAAGGTSDPGVAAAWAAEAGAVTAAQVAEKNAIQSEPPRPTYCNGQYDHTCYTAPVHDDGREGPEDMSPEEARSHTLMYVNGLRSLHGAGLLELDDALTAFAQEGSEELARDHHAHAHLRAEAARCPGCGECQGGADGWPPAPVGKQIDQMLAAMMDEGPGGGHHDTLLDARWTRLGVGIVNPGGRMYFTIDFAP